MFICHLCNDVSKPGELSNNLVLKKRKVIYGLMDKNGNQVGKNLGWEVVKEVKVCQKCKKVQ